MGGRGGPSNMSGGGTNKEAAGTQAFNGVTSDDWFDWAADPEPYQAALNGEKIPEISQADGHRYTDEEIARVKLVAPAIQEAASTNTVSDTTLYRGEMYDSLLEARRKYKIGATVTNDKLTSYARKQSIAEGYASGSGEDGVKVVISNTSNKGRSVGIMTDPFGIGGSDEIISPKGLKSKVKSTRYDSSTNTLYVNMTNNAVPKKRGR